MAALAFIVSRMLDAGGSTAVLVWIAGLSLAFVLPVLAVSLAMRSFRRIAVPLADVMAAADAVAEGDLTARVPDGNGGAFDRLARSFNRMAVELEKTDQLRKNLAADVAHELRTPLHVIQGNLEGILDEVYQPTPEHVRTTLDEARLLGRLVDDLGTLSLAESGQLSLVKERIDVAELLADVVATFEGRAREAGHILSVASGPSAEPIAVGQPCGQRDASHRAGRDHHPDRGAGAGLGEHPRRGHRPRNPRRGPAFRLRSLLERRPLPEPLRLFGRRSGTRDRAPTRPRSRRHHRSQKPGRPRHDFHDPTTDEIGTRRHSRGAPFASCAHSHLCVTTRRNTGRTPKGADGV